MITSRALRVSDNSGWEELIEVDPRAIEESEHAAIKRLTNLIKERDPDVIEGHNLFQIRSAVSGRPGAQGEDEARLGTKRRFPPFAPVPAPDCGEDDRLPEVHDRWPAFRRHLSARAILRRRDAFAFRFRAKRCRAALWPNECAEISQLSGKELQRAWQDDPKRYRERALCAVRETRAVADLLSPSYFIQAQIFPYNYQDVIVRGNATRINALFLREYFRQRHGIPEMPMVRGFEGGYTDIFFTGVARNVWHCDIASLYPSIMLQFDCFPVNDQLQIFRHLLTDLRTFRLQAKSDMRDAKDAAAAALLPRPAKHLQDSDQQLLRLPRFRAGKFCRFRSRRASHADRTRSAQADDRVAESARRAGHRGRHRRDLFRPA